MKAGRVRIPHEAERSPGHGPHGRDDLLEVRGVAGLGARRLGGPRVPSAVELETQAQVRVGLTAADQGLGQGDVVGVVGTRRPLGQRGHSRSARIGRDDRHAQRERVAGSLPGVEEPVQASAGAVHARPAAARRQVVAGDVGRCPRLTGEGRDSRWVRRPDIDPLLEAIGRQCIRILPGPEEGRRAVGGHQAITRIGRVDDDAVGVHASASRRAVERRIAESEDAAVVPDEPVAAAVGRRGHADDRQVQADGTRRTVEGGVAVAEDAAVRSHQPVAVAVVRHAHADNRLVEHDRPGGAVEGGVAVAEDATVGSHEPVPVAVVRRRPCRRWAC